MLLRRLEKEINDPLPRRLARAVRVIRRLGVVEDFAGAPKVDLLRVAAAGGISTRSIHSIHAVLHPQRTALVDEVRSLTYREAEEEINRIAQALHHRFGVQPGEPVVLMMENRVEYLLAWFALFRIGAKAVHASYRLKPQELEYQLEHSRARVVILSESCLPVAAMVSARHDDWHLRVVLVAETRPRGETADLYKDVVAAAPAAPLRWKRAEETAENVVYTSGTTGKPKGAVRDFKSLSPAEFFRMVERLPLHVGDHHLVVTPLYHSGGQAFALMNTALGATVRLLAHFEPEPALRAMSEHHIHSMFMVPTMIHRILDLPADVRGRYPTPELKAIISGAAAFPHALRVRAIEQFGAAAIFDFYGATELGWVTTIDGAEMLRKPGSVGRPNAGQEVRICDERFRRKGAGEVGLIYVRNDQTMAGYLHDARSTAESRRGDWITVEDLGYLDEDGYLFLAGRARDMVISGGVNIYPAEIEDVLLGHPAVDDVAVIGVPDAEWGERLVGIVVARAAAFDPADVTAFARERLAGYKVPREWHLVDELPRNPTGKVLKRQLRDAFAATPT